MSEPSEPEDTVVEVPTTVVVTQDDGTAAAVAVEAEERSEDAEATATAAAETAVVAEATAEAAGDAALSAHEELQRMRAEFGEVRPILAELLDEARARREAAQAEQSARETVQEVPVNDRAAADQAKRSANTDAESSADDNSGSEAGSPAPRPGRTNGLRRRHR
jgi:hypothetical protein